MKRYGNLFPQIVDFANLLSAARKAQRGKRFRPNVLEFNYNLEGNLLQLQEELKSKAYSPGAYRTFDIYEPKRRLISAAPYRDRIVHHALCNIIVPLIERSFISDSYANRVGFGTHSALRRFTEFARSSKYILQCDVRKYFPSIDHNILKELLRRKIKCPETLWLLEKIIDNSNPQEPVIEYFPGDDLLSPLNRRRGLPIGNLTSQFFGNFYLNSLDHFVKEQLKTVKYIRFADDFALFSDSWEFLAGARITLESHLATLRLKIHPIKSQLFETRYGASFVGFRILPDRIRVRQGNLRRARRWLRQLREDWIVGKIRLSELNRLVQSWFAHLQHGDTWRLRQKILTPFAFML
ncbi:MAG: RNA-directed DNA polymerase [Oscillatoria princeps RMCB-10]|jgi:retron-type reverse transcriptase|nr:RNA-directed DNA polymerase [Oscillatoria princeps RMCB-10]